jgi:uncharacterized protein (TIGR02285 family)
MMRFPSGQDVRRVGRASLCLILLALPLGLRAETISWVLANIPPFFAREGPVAGHGVGDQQLAYLMAQMPEFTHEKAVTAGGRVWFELDRKDNVCSAAAIYSKERSKAAIFSHRPIPMPGFALIIAENHRAAIASALSAEHEIDLTRLLPMKDLSGAYVGPRPMGPVLDGFVANPERHVPLAKMIDAPQMYAQLANQHVDFLFAPRVEAQNYFQSASSEKRFAEIPIKGVAPTINIYIVCSNGPRGRAIIAKIDKLLGQPEHWRNFIAPLKGWLNDEQFAAVADQKSLAVPLP